MSNVIDNFKQKIKKITDSIDEASSSIEKEKIREMTRKHELTLNELEKEKQEELNNEKEEYDKRLMLLSSNQARIGGYEYNECVSAAESIYNRKVNEINTSYENRENIENQKYSEMREKYENELKSGRINLLRKKFEILKEKEVNLLVEELNELKDNYNKEKEELERMQKEEEKILKEEYSADEIQDLVEIYIPEEEREKIAKKVLSGYLSAKLIDNYEILIGDEVIKRKVEDKMHNEEYKKEIELRKLNEQKYSEVSETIKQIMALKFEEVILELEQIKEPNEKNNNGEFDSQTR